jgi:TRAP-type C4-dicarboxylate transport system substrate-binding protein
MAALEKNGVTIHSVDKAPFKALVKPLWGKFGVQYPQAKPILQSILK